MSEHDKDDLSRFFRRASQKPQIKFNEDDWTKLETMLDKESVKGALSRKFRRKAGLAAVAGLVFLTVATYLIMDATEQPSKNNIQSARDLNKLKAEQNQNLSAPDPVLLSKNNESNAALSHSEVSKLMKSSDQKSGLKIVAPKTVTANTTAVPYTSVAPMPQEHEGNVVDAKNGNTNHRLSMQMPVNNKQDQRRSMLSSQNEKNITPSTKEKMIFKESSGDQVNNILVPATETKGENIILQKSSENNEAPIASLSMNEEQYKSPGLSENNETNGSSRKKISETTSSPDSSRILEVKTDSIATANSPQEMISKTDSISNDRSSLLPSRWSVLFSFSPDFSSNGLKRLTTPGEAFGITGYYRITRAFNVSLGVIGSNKKYLSYGKEYKPNEDHYWSKHTNGVLPDEIQGSCTMLEIPIGVQYTVANMKKSRLLVAGMLSSYIMFNESYHYTFENENPGAVQSWKSKTNTRYPFSIAGISASYERTVSTRIAIGISPYLKIPLREIGTWANMKLYSLGAAVTIRYIPQKRKLPDRPILQHGSD